MPEYDIIIATDLRFPGGSSASTCEEIKVHHAQGWRTGLHHMPASVLKLARPFNHALSECMLKGEADLIQPLLLDTSTKILMFRHPGVIHSLGDLLPDIDCENVLLIINHPPVNAHGREDYDLPWVVKQLKAKYGHEPKLFPIGPLIREHIESHYSRAVTMEASDWYNVFDLDRFATPRTAPQKRPLKIGRHSRPGPEKWPDTRQKILAAYPEDLTVSVNVLGGVDAILPILKPVPQNWSVAEFGAIAPEEFLQGIDVFVYYHHPRWTEAFGRAIIEAMASGLPVVLPFHFKPLLKDSVQYADEYGVCDILTTLRDSKSYMYWSEKSRSYAEEHFTWETHIKRMKELGLDET